MTTPPALEITALCKSFGGYTAVDHIDLNLAPGHIQGFLGPNGAGKTTTIKMLAGLLRPDSGRIRIMGRDLAREPAACKAMTGYIPDRPYLYEKLTGREFLRFIAGLYQLPENQYLPRADRLLEIFDLHPRQDHLIESYSHGMRQKLIITSVFMLAPPLIIVDEPMVGLDPKSARVVKDLFKEFTAGGGAVFLSTHSLEVAEELCHSIAIITQGRLRAEGTMAALRTQANDGGANLEEIFLELTGARELTAIIDALRETGP